MSVITHRELSDKVTRYNCSQFIFYSSNCTPQCRSPKIRTVNKTKTDANKASRPVDVSDFEKMDEYSRIFYCVLDL